MRWLSIVGFVATTVVVACMLLVACMVSVGPIAVERPDMLLRCVVAGLPTGVVAPTTCIGED